MRHNRTAAGTSALVLAAACLAAAPVTAQAAPRPAAVSYAALGDSYSSGVGAGDYLPGRPECKRSSHAYPVLWAEAHRMTSFAFAACDHARAGDVLAQQLGSLGPHTRLVTLTVGGGDVGFASVMTTCAVGGAGLCRSAVAGARSALDGPLPAALDRLYSAIRNRAPAARVVVLGYPHLYRINGTCRSGLQDSERADLNRAVDQLDAVIARRAAAHGFAFADVRAAFAGHEICSGTPWLHSVDLLSLTSSYHPTARGQARGYLAALDRVS
ncbi:SGNH/GDSL hydrolase family protein [Streptomyces sp. NBC_00557]|uniref:SGNH/GDSL hydrolase family protein n=1 Tax=Streptomyces sp. NBC_00557 TaxID=2975776 RepID=UPI002E7FF872|nr:SGNH/GDSL hydrolase family protein [Streptomyces sp. NBC_00557]WUC36949.1 SGNH/GDSL hydrolase family protein [Streptomyces sp. NBC_00557]